MSARRSTLKVCTLLLVAACTVRSAAADELYKAWLAMYDLNFQDAHRQISQWEAAHPDTAMGPTSHATGYLLAEAV